MTRKVIDNQSTTLKDARRIIRLVFFENYKRYDIESNDMRMINAMIRNFIVTSAGYDLLHGALWLSLSNASDPLEPICSRTDMFAGLHAKLIEQGITFDKIKPLYRLEKEAKESSAGMPSP